MGRSVCWLTGLSGSGKSTIADEIYGLMGSPFVRLDGDAVRDCLCNDLGFGEEDRDENLRRVACLCLIFCENRMFPICTFVSPTNKGRQVVRDVLSESGIGLFLVYLATPLEVCEARDPKGLYARARAGEIPNFTGVGQPYEEPADANLVLDTSKVTVPEAIREILTEWLTSVQ